MRTAFLLFGLVYWTGSFSQDIARQVSAIVIDASANFSSFKGPFKISGSDTAYHSTITLEGTYENELCVNAETGWSYRAVIADSITERRGKKIVTEWKDKLLNILGGQFSAKKIEPKPWNPALTGWILSRGQQDIYVVLYQDVRKSSSCTVIVTFYP